MSKLLTEISRIHELMGISKSGYNPLKKMLLNEDTGYGEIMKIYEKLFLKTTQQLDETEQTYLKNFIDEYNKKFPNGKITYTGVLDNVTREALQKTIRNESDDIIKELFSGAIRKIQRSDLILGSSNLIKSDTFMQNYLKNRKVDIGGMINSASEPVSAIDILVFINKNGGEIEKTNISLDSYDVLKSEFESMIRELPADNAISKNMSDIIDQIDEYNGVKTVIEHPEIERVINDIKGSNSVTNDLTNFKNVSEKLKSLADSDQTMRQGYEIDIKTDIANQTELKNLMGVDKENFIKDLKTFEDLENLWVIVQHSDNDIEFQKEILKILQNNQQTLETKFSTNSQDIKMGIAMLEDRVLINSKTSSSNFGDLTQGLQKYGSQGGLTDDGYWIPRPIDIDGNPIYFKTPNEWYNLNKETLNKINSKRSSMGLPNIEDYIKNMNDKFGNSSGSVKTTEDLSPRLKNKYEKVLNKIDKDLPLDKSEQQLKDDVEKFLNGENINLKDYEFTKTYIDKVNIIIKNFTRNKKEYTSILKELIASIDNTTKITSNIENTFPKGLDKNIRNAINSDPNLTNFFKKLEEGKYGWVIDNETKEWIPTNMLDTNTNDRTTLFRDVLDIVMENDGKKLVEFTTLPEEEQKKLMNDVLTYIKTNKDSLKYKLLDSDRYIKNSQVSLVRGDAGEKLAKQTFEDNGFKVVWEGGRGNALDKTGVDMIVEKDGVYSLVSVKTIGHPFYAIAKGNKTGKPLIGFRQPTKIVTDTGYAAVIDTENRLIIFPPQPKFSEETGEIVGKGFNNGKKLWTNVDLSSILIKNF